MRGAVGSRPAEHSLFSRQRTSSVERELASTPYAFSPKPLGSDDPIKTLQRAKESLLNPFEDDINVRLAKQRLFIEPASPSVYHGSHFGEDIVHDALSNISERLSESSSIVGNLSRVNSEEATTFPTAPDVLPPIRAEVTHLSTYQKSRALAEAYNDKYFRSAEPEVQTEDAYRGSVDNSRGSSDSDVMVVEEDRLDAFTVLPVAAKSEDLDSVTSTLSSFKVTPSVRSHRVTAFAIVAEAGPPAPVTDTNSQESEVVIAVQAPSIASSTGRNSSTGRVSPFRGKGFKQDPFSRHTTPKTSTTTSPQLSRSNSLTKPIVSFERPVTPPRDYIKENIMEVHEMSKFNRERNEELAQQKKMEEEMEILKELGLISENSIMKVGDTPKFDIRSRMTSPSAIMHYENISNLGRSRSRAGDEYERSRSRAGDEYVRSRSRVGDEYERSRSRAGDEYERSRSRTGDEYERFSWKPPTGKSALKSLSKSQPQSKTGSPQHHSKIPRRQASVSPPRKHEVVDYGSYTIMSNALSPDGRFISNSTSSINDRRVYSQIVDDDNNPIQPIRTKSRSRSSQNLAQPASILKSKPPKSPNNLGPPPTSKLATKRLSPIASTPDKSTASSTPNRRGVKSKTPTPKGSTPSKLPSRSKSLVSSPTNSKATSRAPSRGPSRAPSRAGSKGNIAEPETPTTKSKLNRNAAQKSMKMAISSLSIQKSMMSSKKEAPATKETDKKFPLSRMNSRTSITSKTSGGSKPELKRMNSKASLLSQTNSIMTINDKFGNLRKKASLKNLQEKSFDERSMKSEGRPGARQKGPPSKRDVSTSRSINDVEAEKQDNETQYDKLSNKDVNVDRLIPLTKGNVVSMTTAAITSQPLEIAAKVTSQLPAAFEKAREKGMFDRNSSSDSIALKTTQDKTDSEGEGNKGDAKTKLQKTASKTSLGSVKEEKESTKSGPIIQNNMKLIPLDKVNLDPQLEKVKKKIDNILKSDQSSVVDLKEKLEKDSEKVSSTLEKVAEKIEEEVKISTTTAVIEKVEEKTKELAKSPSILSAASSVKTAQSIKKVTEPKAEIKPAEEKREGSPPKQTTTSLSSEINLTGEKAMTPVKKSPPKETPRKTIEPKAELVVVKESVVKKETLTPVVEVINEKTLGKPPVEAEHVTESVIRGDPDVEVQSGNVSPAVRNLAKGKATSSITNGATNGTTNGATNGSSSISNGASKLPHNDSKGVDSIKAGSKSILGSPISGRIKDDIDVEKALPEGKESICKKFMGQCPQKMLCCGKKPNSSEVHLIDEKVNKKNKKKLEAQAKKGKTSWLSCCRKKSVGENEMVNISKPGMGAERMAGNKAEEAASPGCLSCCKRKNKIRDSSADRKAVTNQKWYHKICCCCCKGEKQKKQDWAARRDSILSQHPPASQGCCGGCMNKLLCCKKAGPKEESRRTSLFSKKRSLSQAVPIEDTRHKLDPTLIEHNSHMRGAIPALPIPLAWICFVCNIVIPGLGTILSGMFCLCFGRPRFGMYDGWKPRIGAFIIDIFIGAGQLFTVLFCLVGWGWSIWWGSMMIRVARKYKKLKLASEDPEKAQPTNNHRAAKA